MTTLSWVPRINISKTFTVVPVVSNNVAYTSGDQLGGIMTLTDIVRQDSQVGFGVAELCGIKILDAMKQDAIMDIWFFNQSPTVTSVDNGPFAMTSANQKSQCIAQVILTTSNGGYSDAAVVSTGEWANLNVMMKVPGTVANPTNIYAISIVRATPTYTSTTALDFEFKFYVD